MSTNLSDLNQDDIVYLRVPFKKAGKRLTMRFADTCAYIKDGDKDIGSVECGIGGTVQLSIESEGFENRLLLDPRDLWNVFVKEVGHKGLIMEKSGD